MQKLNNTLLINQWIKEETKAEAGKYLETSENIIYQNIQELAEAVLAINAHINNEKKSQINNLNLILGYITRTRFQSHNQNKKKRSKLKEGRKAYRRIMNQRMENKRNKSVKLVDFLGEKNLRMFNQTKKK